MTDAVTDVLSERERTIFALWAEVNRIADETEDSVRIRALIGEAGISPRVHIGTPAEQFTPVMVAEWVLGSWADMIDQGSPFLNSMRNVSVHQYDKVAPHD